MSDNRYVYVDQMIEPVATKGQVDRMRSMVPPVPRQPADLVVGQRYRFEWVDWIDDESGESMLMTSEGVCVAVGPPFTAFRLDSGAEVTFPDGYYPELGHWELVEANP